MCEVKRSNFLATSLFSTWRCLHQSTLHAFQIFFYQFELHPNISKVLNHYVSANRVEVRPLTLPGHQPEMDGGLRHIYLKRRKFLKRQNEVGYSTFKKLNCWDSFSDCLGLT